MYRPREPPSLTAAAPSSYGPLVSCLMVFGDSRRLRLARLAVEHFVAQIYPAKELIIVNASGTVITTVPHPQIVEHVVDPALLGTLRNLALDAARGAWLVNWDDDDWSHPLRLWFQMAAARPGYACLLSRQLRCAIDLYAEVSGRVEVAARVSPTGVISTMLFPATAARYDPLRRVGEDMAFWERYWASRTVVATNGPLACLHVAFHHGANITGRELFLAGPGLPPAPVEQEHLRHVLALYGLFVDLATAAESS